MRAPSAAHRKPPAWNPIPDPPDRFSSGIPDLDRLLGGGFQRGSMALLHLDAMVETRDWERLLTPSLLNFLYQSNGVMAVLPSRESPLGFRTHLTQWVSRRRFDSRVRLVTYTTEDSEGPYVVGLRSRVRPNPTAKDRRETRKDMERMVAAERAVRGARGRRFLELIAFEIAEINFGVPVASRMFFHGIKRTRQIGGLCVGLVRPGLGCTAAVQAMADVELALGHDGSGLELSGIRPAFPAHRVEGDSTEGVPHVRLVPVDGTDGFAPRKSTGISHPHAVSQDRTAPVSSLVS